MPAAGEGQAARLPNGRFPPGVSGNPTGAPKRLQIVRDAIDEERDPQKVKQMLAALFERGMGGDNNAAKLWLEHIVPMTESALPDLTTAPDNVVQWLRDQEPS